MDQTGGGTVRFTAGNFDFGSEHFEFYEIADIHFRGQGIDTTLLRNNSSDPTDTEPFDFVGADRVSIRDLTVDAGGRRERRVTRSTSTSATMSSSNA